MSGILRNATIKMAKQINIVETGVTRTRLLLRNRPKTANKSVPIISEMARKQAETAASMSAPPLAAEQAATASVASVETPPPAPEPEPQLAAATPEALEDVAPPPTPPPSDLSKEAEVEEDDDDDDVPIISFKSGDYK